MTVWPGGSDCVDPVDDAGLGVGLGVDPLRDEGPPPWAPPEPPALDDVEAEVALGNKRPGLPSEAAAPEGCDAEDDFSVL